MPAPKRTVSVVEDEIHFTDTFHVEVSGDLAGLWGYAVVDDLVDSDQEPDWAQYIKLSITNAFVAGPTPNWQGGGATGEILVGNWGDNRRWRTVAKCPLSILP